MRSSVTDSADPLAGDFDDIFAQTEAFWNEIRGKRLFVTGGTGFFGIWLLEAVARANRRFGAGTSVVVLTRSVERFRRLAPRLAADSAIRFHVGDVAHFTFPEGDFSHLIHMGSTSAEATFNSEPPLAKFETIVEGTRHTLDFAVRCGARKFLYTSSGSVYGRQPPSVTHVAEDYSGAPDPTDPEFALGHSKRAAEFLTVAYAKEYGFEATIARCFSFVGPYLQMDIHYAIGNFIWQAFHGKRIEVTGDGTQCRSYLYASDLIIWLLSIMSEGQSGRSYNVGSEETVTIGDLARKVAKHAPQRVDVRIATKPPANRPPERYVPSTQRAREDLGLRQQVSLDEGIARTVAFLQHALVRLPGAVR